MSILDEIVATTREDLKRRKRDVSLAALEGLPYFERMPHSLAGALRTDELAFIAEIKRASPSQGVIRNDFDPVDLARQYTSCGAAAISVLTEPHHFQGDVQFLEDIRPETALPLLRKDFIVDAYQLVEARAYGADAVLLIAAILERSQLFELHQAADELGLSCLVEVYELKEIDNIDLDQVTILGVNNRDLHTFEVNVNHSLDVFRHVPENVLHVAESGLRRAEDLAHLHANGVDAVLVGETLMRAKRPGKALAQMKERVRGGEIG